MPLSIAAVIRFSVVNFQSMKAFRSGKEASTAEDLRRTIFDSRRLEGRWRLFTSLTLPSMDVISKRYAGFFAVVLVSPELPILWRSKLNELAASRPWLLIRGVGFEDHIQDVIRTAISEGSVNDRVFAFRIDDDDGLSVAAIDKIARLAKSTDDGFAVAFDRGFFIRPLPLSRLVFDERVFKNIAIGLGVFSSKSQLISPFNMGHHRAPRYPIINIGDQPYWLRLIHSSNDSTASVGSRWSIGASRRRAADRMSAYFPGLDLTECLSAL